MFSLSYSKFYTKHGQNNFIQLTHFVFLADEICRDGFYGANCRQECGMCNLNRCQPADGKCLNGCVDGKQGDFCQKGEQGLCLPLSC